MRMRTPVALALLWLCAAGGAEAQTEAQTESQTKAQTKAPELFQVLFETSVGDFTIEVHRDWTPLGADRFYALVDDGYYNDSRFHRTVPGFIVQFGLAGDPALTRAWQHRYIADDSVVASNTRGRIAYAFTDPETRATQVYISTVDNSRLDAGGFPPFGEVVDGMDVVDSIYSGYGEESGGGVRRGDQSRIVAEGNAYLDAEFPKLTRLIRASVVDPGEGRAARESRAAQIDTAAITRWAQSMMGPGQFPAAAVVVVDAEGPLYMQTFGESGTDFPLTPDSRFQLGTAARLTTALAVRTLVDEGLVALDAPLKQYLPPLRFSDPGRGSRVTVGHLLRHSSGLPTIAAFNRRVQETGQIDRVPFFADPGTEVEYSGLNDQLLGALVEAVSGMPYPDFMAERVFGPAGMLSTSAVLAARGVVEGHSDVFGWPIPRDEPQDSDRVIPMARLVSTPSDVGRLLGRYLRMEANVGANTGWRVSGETGATLWAASGTAAGFYAGLTLLPDEGLGVAVLVSRNAWLFRAAPVALSDGVVQVVRGVEPEPYFPWERIFGIVLGLLIAGGIFETARLHRKWKSQQSPRRMAHTPMIVGRVILDLTLAAALPLWIIRGVAKLPIQEVLTFHPDIGIALILFPALAIPAAVLRSLVASEDLRQRS
jgi:peptidyl-prolyl cis-trans isomerase A (cyclophilin A)